MKTYMQQFEGIALEHTAAPPKTRQPSRARIYSTTSVGSTESLLELIDKPVSPKDDTTATFSRCRISLIIFQLSGVNFFLSLSTGLVFIGLPQMAADVNLPAKLYLWPASVYNLATGATLLLAGAVADVIGARWMNISGCFGIALLTLGVGFVQNGERLIALRACQGIATSMHLPSSISICSKILPSGRRRNVAFSCLGLSQPLGFSLGLVLGGVFVDTVGWRVGWYLCGAASLALSFLAVWSLPADHVEHDEPILKALASKIDWVGAGVATVFVTMMAYVLAVISDDVNNIRHPEVIVMLCVSVVLIPSFAYWMSVRTNANRPALIPNSIWKNMAFTSICLIILLSFSVIQSMELVSSHFFREVQHLSAFQSSLRMIPSLIVGTALNLTTGIFMNKISAIWLITISALLSAGSPLLMAIIPVNQPYWGNALVAQLLQPLSVDVLYTVGLIVISEAFPENMQGLAGAIFNTVGQFGMALGLALMQVVSMLVSQNASGGQKSHPEVLMVGYRATYWVMFASMIMCVLLGGVGLRKVGKVGLEKGEAQANYALLRRFSVVTFRDSVW